MTFDGETFDEPRDGKRLKRQLNDVRNLMIDGNFRTLMEIAIAIGAPESSVSARLRDLRKLKFGGYIVEKQYLGDGLYTYRVSASTSVTEENDTEKK